MCLLYFQFYLVLYFPEGTRVMSKYCSGHMYGAHVMNMKIVVRPLKNSLEILRSQSLIIL